jgi:hypothetical protein
MTPKKIINCVLPDNLNLFSSVDIFLKKSNVMNTYWKVKQKK